MVRRYKVRKGKQGGRFYIKNKKKHYLKKGQSPPQIGKKLKRGRPKKSGVSRYASSGRIKYKSTYKKTGKPRGRPRGKITKTVSVNNKRYRLQSSHSSRAAALRAAPKYATIKKAGGKWNVYVRNRISG